MLITSHSQVSESFGGVKMENDRAMIDDVADLLETTGFHEFSQMIRSDFPEATHGDELPNECTWFPFVMAFVLVVGAVVAVGTLDKTWNPFRTWSWASLKTSPSGPPRNIRG